MLEDGTPDYVERNRTTFVLLKDRDFGETGQFDIMYDPKTTSYLEPTESRVEMF